MSEDQRPDKPDFKCARVDEPTQKAQLVVMPNAIVCSEEMQVPPELQLFLQRPLHAIAKDRQFIDAATIVVCEPFTKSVPYYDLIGRRIDRDVTITAIGKFFKKGTLRFQRHYEEIRDAIIAWVPKEIAIASIQISTLPRYKQSEISGDEWRISAVANFVDNNNVKVHRITAHEVKEIVMTHSAVDNDWECFPDLIDDKCDQEGCSREAKITLKLKQDVCTSCGNQKDYDRNRINYRQFCDDHSRRGDCGIDDCDSNYVCIENESVAMNRQPPVPKPAIDETAEFSDSSDW